MINPNHELFRWGPIPGKPLYVSYFMNSIVFTFPKIYKFPWSEIIFYFVEEKMTFICDYPQLRAVGEKHFLKWIMNDTEFALAKEKYDRAVLALHSIHQEVKDLHLKNEQQLSQLYVRWQQAYFNFWDYSLLPELANWGGEKILNQKLKEIGIQGTKFIRAFEKLSAPEKYSFYIEEELDLLKLKLKENYPDFPHLLQQHVQKYFWISNSYHKIFIRDKKFFQDKLDSFTKEQAKEKINYIQKLSTKTAQEKKEIIEELGLSLEIQKIAERLSYCIYWQDARKKQIFIANHYLRLFVEELARRKKISLSLLEQHWCSELQELMNFNKETKSSIAKRNHLFLGHYLPPQELKLVEGNHCKKIIAPFLKKKIAKNVREIKGIVVSMGAGKVQGRVRIILNPNEAKKLHSGEILVAPFTSPEYIMAMKKAAAIITDEGGLTSHAAIVSRELGIPCLVGTKIATKVLKDGDLVQVDANHGLVRKIN